ncbi:hypothetical protein PROFUN_12892 [Planoprotostelium fungivorum]|uniref:Uncharacterized protein n=1 Tax=Planoprotostelium fungivorum TaxID=1890364 RepID=A0A2P6MWL4_9EUKA|nr:hypothetical protein PROFUN_12892 [Planoprotostelium fungivorum]
MYAIFLVYMTVIHTLLILGIVLGALDHVSQRKRAIAWVLHLDQKPHDSEDILFGNYERDFAFHLGP